MRLSHLKIENFRGLSFEHDFSDDQFIVLTGVNGSGKSTIIDVISILLTKRGGNIQEPFAKQATGDTAILDIMIEVNDNEIDYIARKIEKSQPDSSDYESILQSLKNDVFRGNKFSHKLIINKPIVGWSARDGGVKEYLNGQQINDIQHGFDKIISQHVFSVISRVMVIRFDQLENVSLQYSNFSQRSYSVGDIFQGKEDNVQQRISRMNMTTSPLLNSLIEYDGINYDKLDKLLEEYSELLSPLAVSRGNEDRDTVNIVLSKDNTVEYPIDSASSGQKKAIALVTLRYLWNSSEIKPIVLIDEPENSLHPQLTSRVFESFKKMLENGGPEPSFIVATHSPEVVAALAENTYRIVTSNGSAGLKQVVGLDARADALKELGVHFHLDYVAQKIVFVESESKSKKMTDAEVYQRLIDPQKEQVLFVLAEGGFKQVEANAKFVGELFEKLKSSSTDLVSTLKDRDDSEYDPKEHTPFKHLEYIFVFNQNILRHAIESTVGSDAANSFDTLLSAKDTQNLLKQEKYKDIWEKIGIELKITPEDQRKVQENIIDELRENNQVRGKEIADLIERYRK